MSTTQRQEVLSGQSWSGRSECLKSVPGVRTSRVEQCSTGLRKSVHSLWHAVTYTALRHGCDTDLTEGTLQGLRRRQAELQDDGHQP